MSNEARTFRIGETGITVRLMSSTRIRVSGAVRYEPDGELIIIMSGRYVPDTSTADGMSGTVDFVRGGVLYSRTARCVQDSVKRKVGAYVARIVGAWLTTHGPQLEQADHLERARAVARAEARIAALEQELAALRQFVRDANEVGK